MVVKLGLFRSEGETVPVEAYTNPGQCELCVRVANQLQPGEYDRLDRIGRPGRGI